TRKLVTFGRILREAGLEVGPGRLQDALRGLALVDLADREQVYHALRCTLVARHDHLDIFDAAFTAYWEREPREPSDASGDVLSQERPMLPPPPGAEEGAVSGPADEDDRRMHGVAAARDELLRHRDFAHMTNDELRRVRRLMDDLAALHPVRRSRPLQAAHARRLLAPSH